ncbi:hypothetical protein PSH28_23175 [Pseudomonas resinovorans]|uniref:hypothetical protein n=1 Tax=Metapseudomonas resinovorans TaxID=53412 RepID=UPI00237FD2DA|nr:hypothetical protein [Pseudomonas resinovorans]MDE3739518.1 hypothetical protein [Pseudomonas resinovorans]
MNGFPWCSSKWLMAVLIALVVVLGTLAEHHLRDRVQPRPLQIPAAEPSSSTAPVRADGPLHEVSSRIQADIGIQPRWVF